jgi:hypothetical protein
MTTLVVGCSSSASSPPSSVTSDELRALAPAEIVGDLAYGQTSAIVTYTETPLYRAFRFQGKTGDAVDAWVRSTDGDARAWLLDASFQNVITNDNASAGTTDAHLVTTLKRDGAYYVAFREATREDASFKVTLAGTPASPGGACDPEVDNCPGGNSPPSSGIFDTNPCTGGPLTQAAVTHYFAPAAQISDEVGHGVFHSRKRICNQVTGCTGWQSEAAPITWTGDAATLTGGSFRAQVGGVNVVNLNFAGDDAPTRAPFICTLAGACHLGPGYLQNAVGIHTDTFNATITTSCVYFRFSGSVATGQPAETAESNVVFVGTILAPTH